MKMMRRFFIGNDLDECERFEETLEREGLTKEQIHVLSLDETAVGRHRNLHEVAALMKKDLVHAGWYGFALGVLAALLVLGLAYVSGWTATVAGWLPVAFLAVLLLGFFTWEGGLWGIQQPNTHFRRFAAELAAGRHVMFVDVGPEQEAVLTAAAQRHASIQAAGSGAATPGWWTLSNHRIKHFLQKTMP